MRRLALFVLLVALLLWCAPSAQAKGVKGDAYFGYSRVGANLYEVYTPGMNGWQLAANVNAYRFVGIEGDVSHYGAKAGAGSQNVTLVMFGPRVTLGVGGFDIFAHGLGGVAHLYENLLYSFPPSSYNAVSYALGGGGDMPLFLGFKLRVTGDYLGNSNAPKPGQYSPGHGPQHFRAGVGIAHHF